MNLKSILITILLTSTKTIFSQIIISPKVSIIDTVRFSPEFLNGGNLNEVTKDLEYIPLITSKKKSISKIDDVIFFKESYVIKDEKELFIFKLKDNKLIKIISSSQLGEEKSQIIDIKKNSVDGFNVLSVLIEKSSFTYYLSKFDVFGNMLSHTITPKERILADSITLDKKKFIYNNLLPKENKTILSSYPDKYIYICDSINIGWKMLGTLYPFYKSSTSKNISYFSFWCDYRIFHLSPNGIDKITQFILPSENTVDYSKVLEFKNVEEFEKYNEQYYKISQGFDNIQEYKNKLVFLYRGYPNANIVFDPIEKSFLSLNNLVPDERNDFLPIIGKSSFDYIFCQDDFIYSFIYPIEIDASILKLKEEGKQIKSYVKKLSNHYNPILVKFRIR